MKKYTSLFLAGAVLLVSVSCKKELANTNKNPNGTETPQPDYLLTAASKLTADAYWGVDININSSLLFVQHWAKIQYTDPDRYILTNSSFATLWNTGYAQSITDLNKVISLSADQGIPNYKGVGLVLRSWVFQLLTDNFGAIPFRQAGNIDSFLTPVYNTQQEVYHGLLDDLKTAQASLDPAGTGIQGDPIYNGNIPSWKKFANSLRLRIALRIADREPTLAKQVLDDIKSEGGTYIDGNAAIAQLVYQNSPNQNPISNTFDTRDDYRISKTIIDTLFALNDPRLALFSDTTLSSTPQKYIGMPNGLTVGDAASLGFTKTSKPDSTNFRRPNAPAVIISYAEVLFGLAEAAARGFTTDDAAALYGKAIQASLNQYGVVDQTIIDAYRNQPAVQYNAANYKKSIGNQKWIALFGQGLEAFAEWRRLDYPQLKAPAASVLSGSLPVRFIYPGTEQSLNGANYTDAVTKQGADLLTTKLWFDMY